MTPLPPDLQARLEARMAAIGASRMEPSWPDSLWLKGDLYPKERTSSKDPWNG